MRICSKLFIFALFVLFANNYVIGEGILEQPLDVIRLVEKGDLLFRSNATFDILPPDFGAYIGHTAVYFKWEGGDHLDPNNHRLIEATKGDPNYPTDGVNYTYYSDFLNASGAHFIDAGTKNWPSPQN